MKNQTIQLFVLLVGTVGLHACRKGDQASQALEAIPTKAKVEIFIPTKVTNTGGAFFKSIDTLCGPYLT
jgi:predicted choloylglycine hydrolase